MRITSDGHQPYALAKIEAICTSNTAAGNDGPLGLSVNRLRTPMHDFEIEDTNTSSTPGPTKIAFYLAPEQTRAITFSKTTELKIRQSPIDSTMWDWAPCGVILKPSISFRRLSPAGPRPIASS